MEQNDFKTTQMDSRERLRNLYFQPGDVIAGNYEFVRELGRGGMGMVCLCRDLVANGRLMAVKTVPDILRHDDDAVAALTREYDNMYELRHDNIVSVRHLVKDDYRYYVVMDYAEGETLDAYLKRIRKPDTSVTMEVTRQLAAALDYAHGKGLVHRDVKPGNVMVQIDGNSVKPVKLLDFGLGLKIRESVSHVSGVMTSGTPAYKSPEQWRPDLYDGKLTKQSDQYSLAALVYEMLVGAGCYPFHNFDLATFPNAVLNVAPQRLQEQPDFVNNALQKALAKKPEDRFESCTAFVKAMRMRPETKQAVRSPLTVEQVRVKKSSKRRKWILAVVVLVCVLALFAGLSAERGRKGGDGNGAGGSYGEDVNSDVKEVAEAIEDTKDKIIEESHKELTDNQNTEVEAVKPVEDKIVEDVKNDVKSVGEKVVEAVKENKIEAKEQLSHLKKDSDQQGKDRIVEMNGVKMTLKYIQAGEFMMGSPTTEKDRYDDETQHHVTLTKDYWLGETEVTQEQFEAVMRVDPSYFSKGFPKDGTYPVELVSWADAMAFCERLTKAERDNGNLPDGYEYTLPTEAQWEYAAHGGHKASRYHVYSGSDEIHNVAWYGDNSNSSTHPVGQKRANELGIYDMSGNVWEWCRDWYGAYPSGSVTDPVGPSSGSGRVLRGGSWDNNARYCRSANRYYDDPTRRGSNYGFRVALASVQ